MIPAINSKVKVIFKNGMSAEGSVLEWTDDYAILSSERDNGSLIIYDIPENVIMVRVFDNNQILPHNVEAVEDPEVRLDVPETDPIKRAARMSKLKTKQIKTVRNKVLDYLVNRRPPQEYQQANYEYPNFSK